MPSSSTERRSPVDRRGVDRRHGMALVEVERRTGLDRRGSERRTRQPDETPSQHIRNALQLLATVAQSGTLDDELQRDIDSAMIRLRFAVERLESGPQ